MYCIDCGTKLSGGICPNCSEELYIYREQILTNEDELIPLSDDFIEKVKEQIRKEKQRL